MAMIQISEEVHLQIVEKQTELLRKGIKKRIQDIADISILSGLKYVKVNDTERSD
jgi:hypothetical protein